MKSDSQVHGLAHLSIKDSYFYIYDILTEKILAVYPESSGEKASEDYSQLLKNHGPHILLKNCPGPRLMVGDKIP